MIRVGRLAGFKGLLGNNGLTPRKAQRLQYAGLVLCVATWINATELHAQTIPTSSPDPQKATNTSPPGEKNRLDFKGVPLETALKTLSSKYGFKYRIDSTLSNEQVTVSVQLSGARASLEQLLAQYSYGLSGKEPHYQVDVISRATESSLPIRTPLGRSRKNDTVSTPATEETPAPSENDLALTNRSEPSPPKEVAGSVNASTALVPSPVSPQAFGQIKYNSAKVAPWPGHTVVVNKTGPVIPSAIFNPLPPHTIIVNKTGPVISGLVPLPFPAPPAIPIANRSGPP